MRAIIYNTEAEAKARNEAEATDRGCDGVTTEWWGREEGVDGKWALIIKNDPVIETVTEINDDWFV